MRLVIFLFFLMAFQTSFSQKEERTQQLLNNLQIQIECTEAIDSLYNFKFKVAEKQFTWLKQQHPDHPLAYFLLGLSQWWKIMPNDQVEDYDPKFYAYMDTTIDLARELYKIDKKNPEASFFLSAAYGFKARRLSDHGHYSRAGFASKASLNYLNENQELDQTYSVEFLFGTALYNYFREWIPENKKFLRPIVMFFPKGNRDKGIEQLTRVSKEAFYTRIEALVFLMRIYGSYEDSAKAALPIAEYLHEQYPDNSYIHRFLAKTTFYLGNKSAAFEQSMAILQKVEKRKAGYEAESGRVASYIVASHYKSILNIDSARVYYKQCIKYGNEVDAQEKGYYLSSLYYLGKFAEEEKKIAEAKYYYEQYLEYESDKKDKHYKTAKKFVKLNKKIESKKPE